MGGVFKVHFEIIAQLKGEGEDTLEYRRNVGCNGFCWHETGNLFPKQENSYALNVIFSTRSAICY